jgi:alkanesulfonate monooxygenase SsuD/methylene tetrahydromethanopterin reductase-like flavin-dependent oxidoreductase (luciferase family)
MVIAELGQRTKKIRLGPAVAVPAFHNPLVLAEEYAFADNLCGGRLDFGLGSGFSPLEFKTFGITIEEAKERFWEATEIILKAWRQDQFSHQGKHYQFDNVSLYMKPLQKPMPPTWMAASSDDTLVKAGEFALPIMGIPFARSNSIHDVKAKNDLFKESYVRACHKGIPEIMVALHVCLQRTEEDAVQLARPHFGRVVDYLKTSRRPGSKVPDLDNIKEEKLAVFTSPEDAVAILKDYEKIGVTHVICMVNFGGLPMPDVHQTMELMSKEVFPKFQ